MFERLSRYYEGLTEHSRSSKFRL